MGFLRQFSGETGPFLTIYASVLLFHINYAMTLSKLLLLRLVDPQQLCRCYGVNYVQKEVKRLKTVFNLFCAITKLSNISGEGSKRRGKHAIATGPKF